MIQRRLSLLYRWNLRSRPSVTQKHLGTKTLLKSFLKINRTRNNRRLSRLSNRCLQIWCLQSRCRLTPRIKPQSNIIFQLTLIASILERRSYILYTLALKYF